jgi:cytochrome bd ubiquinol oxidase subunit I
VSPILLARIQFALTIGFHFMWVPLSMGLSLLVVIAERRFRKTGAAADRYASDFWIRLLVLSFAVGVGTGLVMEFAFGMNWASYSTFVGDVFGPLLAAEGIFSFFLESTFIAVLIFGRGRVSERFYYVSTWLVFVGATLSAIWILIANSWQQTPAGVEVINGRAELTNAFAAVLNPSTLPRIAHTVTATWLTGAFVAAGISAYYLLRGRHIEFARRWLRIGLLTGSITSVLMLLIGHLHALEVTAYQPAKLAAMEAVFNTHSNVGLYLMGWVDTTTKTVYGIQIPNGLSLLVGFTPNKVITGLDRFAPANQPPIQVVFQAWHLMVALGMAFIGLMILLYLMHRAGRLEKARWLLWLIVLVTPLPLVAIYSGWAVAELGRQPWVVYHILLTAQAASPMVSAGQLGATLMAFILFYAFLFFAFMRLATRAIAQGPAEAIVDEEEV